MKEHNNNVKRLLEQYTRNISENSKQSDTYANKVYKNLMTQKKKEYSKIKAASEAAKWRSSFDFWKELRTSFRQRKPKLSGSIDKQGWLDHFKQVFSMVELTVELRMPYPS